MRADTLPPPKLLLSMEERRQAVGLHLTAPYAAPRAYA